MLEPQSVSGPYVQIACVCQVALLDNTGSLSVIKVTDRIQVIGTTPEMQPQPLQHYQLAIILKAGDRRETHTIRIIPVLPSGTRLPPAEISALFEGDERGVSIVTPLGLVVTEQGLYWLEVYLEEQLLTRIPLRILYARAQLPPGMQIPPAG